MHSISLYEITERINSVIQFNFNSPIWIRAEISELRENVNGHCYLELIEKSTTDDRVIAKSKATIWSSTYRMLKPYFQQSTGETLQTGMSILIAVTVDFHSIYGFNLNVKDIDPTFTIGEMAARRLKIIRQLEEDGVADMNKQLELVQPAKRIAVISSATAAGYDDFCNQLRFNANQYSFYIKLFPAIMQGDQAEASIIKALEKIDQHITYFDVVVIVRGGGATTDLACFDSYELVLNCAQFPLPILSGIGHQRDISILDMIAYSSFKTPTAVAEFLIDQMRSCENELFELFGAIHLKVKTKIEQEQRHITQANIQLKHTLRNWIVKEQHLINTYTNRLRNTFKLQLLTQKNHLTLLNQKIESHSPSYLLKHGYTISSINGTRINSVSQIKKGEKIRTFVADGDFESIVL